MSKNIYEALRELGFTTLMGKEYIDAVSEMMAIRQKRRELYKDLFLEESDESLVLKIKDKTRRLEFQLSLDQNPKHYESLIDNALDIANYALFVAAKRVK